MTKNKIPQIEVRQNNSEFGHGVSLWINGRWIIDASNFNGTGELTISLEKRFKRVDSSWPSHHRYQFVGDEIDNKRRGKK